MRGDFFHNQILIGALRQVACECGAAATTEHPVWINGRAHYIDLFVTQPGVITACEAELVSARVGNDREKAIAVGAKHLLIATPDALTAQACRRKLGRLQIPKTNLHVIVCPLGAALEILRTILTTPKTQNPHERKSS